MQLNGIHLGYCTNVHPGEGLEALHRILSDHVAEVKRRVSPDAPFGLGLRLGNTVAAELADEAARAALAERMAAHDLYVFTVNGFPYGDFAAESIKEAVYLPDWRDPERVAYTARVAEALAGLPGPSVRTISTVAGGFAPETAGAHDLIAQHLTEAARHLADLAERTGVQIRLCLEPEPWTTLERTEQVIDFFKGPLAQGGSLTQDFLGLCYDCCHQAVYFEDAAESLGALAQAGVVVGKIQVSSALHLDRPADADARAALMAFDEPRYLHQVVGKPRAAQAPLLRALDLPPLAKPDAEWLNAEAWRCHFHVPIWWVGDDRLGTTKRDWEAAVKTAVAAGQCDHLEIETYSWGVIPEAERAALEGGDLHACVASEFAALQAVMGR